MKLYIHTDIEGVAGMVHFEDREDETTEGYHRRRRLHKLLTAEVNAAIEGALEMGVDEILVNDSHGSGYSIIFEELNPAAQIIHGPLTRQPGLDTFAVWRTTRPTVARPLPSVWPLSPPSTC